MPAKAGNQRYLTIRKYWVPASAGTSGKFFLRQIDYYNPRSFAALL